MTPLPRYPSHQVTKSPTCACRSAFAEERRGAARTRARGGAAAERRERRGCASCGVGSLGSRGPAVVRARLAAASSRTGGIGSKTEASELAQVLPTDHKGALSRPGGGPQETEAVCLWFLFDRLVYSRIRTYVHLNSPRVRRSESLSQALSLSFSLSTESASVSPHWKSPLPGPSPATPCHAFGLRT